jgi:hypothetical protein
VIIRMELRAKNKAWNSFGNPPLFKHPLRKS